MLLVLDTDKKVFPVNNTLHSLFSVVRVSVNDIPLVKQPDHYAYKAFFANLFSYSNEVKNCQLNSVGFYTELCGHPDPTTDYSVNGGYYGRNALFRKNYDQEKPYSKDGTKFFGRLCLDFNGLDSGLPPGTKVQIQLVKNNDSFMLLKQKGDTENYQLKITHINLYVPIAQVSAPIFGEINSLFTTKSVALHYRKTEVRLLTIPSFKRQFLSDNLFTDDKPCRLIICFVEDKTRKGDYFKNPFVFQRHWDVPLTANEVTNASKEDFLERKVRLLMEELSQIKQLIQSSNATQHEDEDEIPLITRKGSKTKSQPQGMFTRLASHIVGERQEEDEISEASGHSQAPPSYQDPGINQ